MSGFGVAEAHELARTAHAGKVDATGADYYLAHLVPVAARLAGHGDHAVMAALLHDVIEDTDWDAQRLLGAGVPAAVVEAVVACTRVPGEPYAALVARAGAHPLGRKVKLADVTHNLAGNPALAELDPARAASLRRRYLDASETLRRAGAPGPSR